MKMRWFDRVLLVLGGLVLLALGVFVVLFASNVIRFADISMDILFKDAWQWMPLFILAGAVLTLMGIRIAFRPLWRRKDAQSRYYAVQSVDAGSVHISMQAIDHLIHKCIQYWPEILSTQIAIRGQQEAVTIRLRLTLRSDVRIPELIADVRTEVKDYVEECSGVKVERVEVVIEATKDAVDALSEPKGFAARRGIPSLSAGQTEKGTSGSGAAIGSEQLPDTADDISTIDEMDTMETYEAPIPDRNPIHVSHSLEWTEAMPVPPYDALVSDSAEQNGQALRDELLELDAYVDEVEETEAALLGDEDEEGTSDA